MTVRRTLCCLIAGVLLVLAAPFAASAAGQLEVSRDGQAWHAALAGPLFDPSFRWVPGDVQTEAFYVRNGSTDSGRLSLEMLPGEQRGLFRSGDLEVAVRVGDGAWHSAQGDGARLESVELGPREVQRVSVRVSFDPLSENRTEQQLLDLRFHAQLVQTSGTETTDPDDDGLLPNTGTGVSLSQVAGGVLLVALGALLVLVARRRHDTEEVC